MACQIGTRESGIGKLRADIVIDSSSLAPSPESRFPSPESRFPNPESLLPKPGWRPSMLRRLLIRIAELDERRLVERSAEHLQASGERVVARVAHGDRDRRHPRLWREHLAVVAMRSVEVANESRRIAPGRIDQRVEMQAVHRLRHGRTHGIAYALPTLTAGRRIRRLRHRLRRLEPLLDARVIQPRPDDRVERFH